MHVSRSSIIIYLIAFEVCLALISHGFIPSPSDVGDFLSSIISPGHASGAGHVAGSQSAMPSSEASAAATQTNDEANPTFAALQRYHLPYGDATEAHNRQRLV